MTSIRSERQNEFYPVNEITNSKKGNKKKKEIKPNTSRLKKKKTKDNS
jgi:hypothetical protein